MRTSKGCGDKAVIEVSDMSEIAAWAIMQLRAEQYHDSVVENAKIKKKNMFSTLPIGRFMTKQVWDVEEKGLAKVPSSVNVALLSRKLIIKSAVQICMKSE